MAWTDLAKRCAAEFVGTYILVVVGPTAVILLLPSSSAFALPLVALTFGLTVALMITLFGELSGSIINPAITLAAPVARLLRTNLVIPYIASQTAGGILAGLTLKLMFGSLGDATSLGSTKLATDIDPVSGIAIESIGAFILTFVAFNATTRVRGPRKQALIIGGTLTVLIVLIAPLTSASFNPARSLGPALASGYLSAIYVYIIGPSLGAVLAGLLFRRLQAERVPPRIS